MYQFRLQHHTQFLSGKMLVLPITLFLSKCSSSLLYLSKAMATSQSCCPTPGKVQVSWSQGKNQHSYTCLSSA